MKSHLDRSVRVRYHPTEGFAGRKEKARVNQLELKVFMYLHLYSIYNYIYIYIFIIIQIKYIRYIYDIYIYND